MISGDCDHRQIIVQGYALDEVAEPRQRALRRADAIEYVTSDNKNIGLLLLDGLSDLVENDIVVLVKRQSVELSPKVPIAGVKYAHR